MAGRTVDGASVSNMLHLNSVFHFQMPKDVFKLGRCKTLTPSAFLLYAYANYLAQESSKVTVFISATELKEVLGLSAGTVRSARALLDEKEFVNVSRESDGYNYTLLNLENGKPLVKSTKGDLEPLDFDTLTRDQLEKYYRHHLKGVHDTDKGLSACCPFHDDQTASLDTTLTDGSVWFCHPSTRYRA